MTRFRDQRPDAEDLAAPDLRDCEWHRVATEIAQLRAEGDHRWAEAQLGAMEDCIRESHCVTESQRRALARITESEWSPGRVYDSTGRYRRWR